MACASSYYITLVAKDPDSGVHKTFQTHVDEECCGEFELTSYIARPQGKCDLWLQCSFVYMSIRFHLLILVMFRN